MAIAVLFEIPGMNQAQYDTLMREAFQDQLAPGVLSHVAGPSEAGWWALDVYEAPEVAERLGAQIGPALQALGVTAQPQLTIRPIHNSLTRS